MAKIIKNAKNFKVVQLSKKDAAHLGYGYTTKGNCLCMRCNEDCRDDIYYIAVLNDTMCKDCYNKWVASAHYYADDAPIEEANFRRCVSSLQITE